MLCLPSFLPAQQNKLSVAPPKQISVKRGQAVDETLQLVVSPGLHINSDKPADEFLIPLSVSWIAGPLKPLVTKYPQPEEIKVGAQQLSVFTGTVIVATKFQAPSETPAGPAFMTGKIRYQACNSQMCFRPSSLEIRLPIVVE